MNRRATTCLTPPIAIGAIFEPMAARTTDILLFGVALPLELEPFLEGRPAGVDLLPEVLGQLAAFLLGERFSHGWRLLQYRRPGPFRLDKGGFPRATGQLGHLRLDGFGPLLPPVARFSDLSLVRGVVPGPYFFKVLLVRVGLAAYLLPFKFTLPFGAAAGLLLLAGLLRARAHCSLWHLK